nr:bacteriophage Gp15 family protein [uncultured Ligilactobacillus sp.]
MLSLTNDLIDSVVYKGKEYKLDFSFDNVIRFYEMLDDEEFDDNEKIGIAIEMLFENPKAIPNDEDFILKTIERFSDVINESPYGNSNGTDVNVMPTRYFSYTKDAGAIYASFMQQYHIDLEQERGKLHWDKFKALFDGLGEDTYIQRIISIRQKTTNNVDDPKEVQAIVEAQNYFRLEDPKYSVEQQNQAINAMFKDMIAQNNKNVKGG